MTENYYKQYEPIFGVWRITRLIGEGFQSKVFEMEREDFGVTYKAALKAITIPAGEKQVREVMDEGMDEKGVYQYFYTMVKDQVKQLAFVNQLKGNTNVVSFENHQVIEHKDGIGWDILIQMELLTPFQEFQKKHPITEREAARIGIDLCRALELCGKFQIIHGDVKPDNLFVSDMGDFKLGGFDIARVNEPGCTASSGKGTLSYMAPEVRTKGQGDAGSDLYSLGLVLYQLLNDNRLPFLPAAPAPVSFQDRNEALMKRFSGAPLPPPVRAGEQMAKILLKACAFRPGERYRGPEELRRDLEAYLRGGFQSCAIQNKETLWSACCCSGSLCLPDGDWVSGKQACQDGGSGRATDGGNGGPNGGSGTSAGGSPASAGFFQRGRDGGQDRDCHAGG